MAALGLYWLVNIRRIKFTSNRYFRLLFALLVFTFRQNPSQQLLVHLLRNFLFNFLRVKTIWPMLRDSNSNSMVHCLWIIVELFDVNDFAFIGTGMAQPVAGSVIFPVKVHLNNQLTALQIT